MGCGKRHFCTPLCYYKLTKGKLFAMINFVEMEKRQILNIVTQAFIGFCFEAYLMDHKGFHGYAHWMRVPYNGRLLAKVVVANTKVVELFCLLHDTQRLNENRDPEHGYRAAKFARALNGN